MRFHLRPSHNKLLLLPLVAATFFMVSGGPYGLEDSRGVPWVSVLVCGLGWALALKLPFEKLISIDLTLYGSSLILEFLALIALRLREPQLPRPFSAGSFPFACALAVGPTILIACVLFLSRSERLGDPGTALGNVSSPGFALLIALLGPLLYWFTARPIARRRAVAATPATD